MFDWLYSLRQTPAVPRGRRGNPSAQSALVQTLEPREMLTLLVGTGVFASGLVPDPLDPGSFYGGLSATVDYQSESEYQQQIGGLGSSEGWEGTIESLGSIGSVHGFPGDASIRSLRDINYYARSIVFGMNFQVLARSEPFIVPEDAGDRAYVYTSAEASTAHGSFPEGEPWEYRVQAGGETMLINQDTPESFVSRVSKVHIGDQMTLKSTAKLTGSPFDGAYVGIADSVYVKSFTLDTLPKLGWATNEEGENTLSVQVDTHLSNFDRGLSAGNGWHPVDGAWDLDLEQLTDPGLLAGTKVKLVWSTTPSPAGAVADAYEITLGEREENGYSLITNFAINPADLASAPASAKYLVAITDTEDQLWESDETNNYDAIEPPTVITEVKAEFDDDAGTRIFGKYLAGVPLDTKFTVNTFDPQHIAQSVRYTITNGSTVVKTGSATGTAGVYVPKIDVGTLPKGTLNIKFELLNGTGAVVGEAWEGTIVVTDQLEVDFKGAANGEAMNTLDKLRFIAEIPVRTDFEASLAELPLFDAYKKKFQLVIRENNSSKHEEYRIDIEFAKSGGKITAQVDNLVSSKLKNLQEGSDYEVLLGVRPDVHVYFGSRGLMVEKLPKWLSGTVQTKTSIYDYTADQFVIYASYPPQLVNVTLPVPNMPFGLFKNAVSELSAGLEFEVRAGLVTTASVTAHPKTLKASVKLLDKPVFTSELFDVSTPTSIPLENKVKLTDPAGIKLSGKFNFAQNVNLFKASIGESKDFSLTKTIMSALSAPANALGILDLNVGVEGTLESLDGTLQLKIIKMDDNPEFDSKESYFQIDAKAKASANAKPGASLKINGEVIASAGIEGTVWVRVEGKAAISFSGSVLSPSTNTIRYDETRTRLAAQFGADINLTAQWANDPPYVKKLFNPKSQVYTLFGNDSVEVSLQKPDSFAQAGDGIVTPGGVARYAAFTSEPVIAAAPSVSTLTFKDALNSNTGRIQLDYDITSTIKPLAAGRHRLEVVAVPFDTMVTETVLGTVDLSTLTLSTDPQGGFRSAAQSLILNLPPDQLDPRLNQRLVLRLINDPAGGETVRLRPSAINVTVSEPTLSMTAPNGILNDGAIVFGAETGGATAVNLQLTNTAGPMLLIDDLRVEGTNLRVNPLDELELYGNDLPTSITVEVINPALAASGTLRFKTNDPTRPEVSIPLSFIPPNTAPTIGGLPANQAVNDTATISPFSAITVNDPNNQNMLAKVTILNGTVRGDFTAASATGWTRSVSGNNIVYSRFYNPQANIGAIVQAALRGFVYVPRKNVIKPNTTELTDIQVFVNDGVANTTATTRLTTTSVNDAPFFGGITTNVAVNDNATVNPLATLTVTDADMQEMLISVTILNGINRGDFTNATAANGWTVRQVLGNNITYKRYFGPQANIGAVAQAAFRALVFQPRQNAIKPGTTELTDFQVTVSDGVAAAVANSGTRVTTTSINNAPTIAGTVANQTMNDNQTKPVFSTLTVTDPDFQDQFVRVTITNGTTRGDFTSASTSGWTRKLSGTNILYERFFAAASTNSGTAVHAAIRALIFQPRTNVPVGTTETTTFTVFINDGIANATNGTASVITTGVAARTSSPPPSIPIDEQTVVLPTLKRTPSNSLARLLGKQR